MLKAVESVDVGPPLMARANSQAVSGNLMPLVPRIKGCVPGSSSTEMPTPRELVQAFIDAFGEGSLEPLRPSLSESFVHEILPRSAGFGPKGRDEYLAWVAGAFPAFKDGKVKVGMQQS